MSEEHPNAPLWVALGIEAAPDIAEGLGANPALVFSLKRVRRIFNVLMLSALAVVSVFLLWVFVIDPHYHQCKDSVTGEWSSQNYDYTTSKFVPCGTTPSSGEPSSSTP